MTSRASRKSPAWPSRAKTPASGHDDAFRHFGVLTEVLPEVLNVQGVSTFLDQRHRPQFAVLDPDDLARVEEVAGMAFARENAGQQSGRPLLAQPRDEVQYFVGKASEQRQAFEQVFQLCKGLLQRCAQLGIELQRLGTLEMSLAQRFESPPPVRSGMADGRGVRDLDQCVGGALHRRDDDRLTVFRQGLQKTRDIPNRPGIGETAAAELVDYPTHFDLLQRIRR